MFLTIHDSMIASLAATAASGGTTGPLIGLILDGGDVYQIQGISPASGQQVIGRWLVTNDADVTSEAVIDGELLLLFNPADQTVRPLLRQSDRFSEIPFDVIRLHADYSARIRGLFEADALIDSCVTIIGVGTGGGTIALQLAKAGVGRLRLVDFDRLEVHNIARHVCGLRDIGRYKTRALRDLLIDASPLVTVETWESNILDQTEVLETVITGCDLVIAATDSERSKSAINAACWSLGIPAIYGAAYNRAFGGDIIQVVPGQTGCYECFLSVAIELFNTETPGNLPTDLPYEDPQRLADALAEPGLSVDVGMIALIHARMALLTLLRDKPSQLVQLPTNWVLWGNRQEWLFQKPLESIFIDVPRRSDCPFCNRETYVRTTLGMTEAEAEAEGAKRLASIPEVTISIASLSSTPHQLDAEAVNDSSMQLSQGASHAEQ